MEEDLEVSISSCADLRPLVCVCVWGDGGEISCSCGDCVWEWGLQWQADESEGVHRDGL